MPNQATSSIELAIEKRPGQHLSTPPRPKRCNDQTTPGRIIEISRSSGKESDDDETLLDVQCIKYADTESRSGLVSRSPNPMVLKMSDSAMFNDIGQRSMLVYDQLNLMSDLFEGEVIGPTCLYINAKPGQEDVARTCIESIDTQFLLKISCVKHANCATIK